MIYHWKALGNTFPMIFYEAHNNGWTGGRLCIGFGGWVERRPGWTTCATTIQSSDLADGMAIKLAVACATVVQSSDIVDEMAVGLADSLCDQPRIRLPPSTPLSRLTIMLNRRHTTPMDVASVLSGFWT